MIPITLLGITFLVFCLSRMVPGGPVERLMQEQAMGALAGDKSLTTGSENISNDDIERLEELFNLNEPLPVAYLQWLGLWPQAVEVSKAEFNDSGTAVLTLSGPSGRAEQLQVQREGDTPLFMEPEWLGSEHWRLHVESPQQRAQRVAARRGITDPAAIAKLAEGPDCRRWRIVARRMALDGLLEGSLGRSYKYNEPVSDMMLDRLPVSLYFGLLGALITYLISVPLGVYKALRHRSWFDSLTSIGIFVGYAVPGFALGAVLLVYLGARLEWFPLYGLVSPDFDSLSTGGKLRDLLLHTVLPLSCYVVSSFAMTTMMMKNNLMENMSADYVRTAMAKGSSYRRAVWRHAFRNSFIPIVSGLGSTFGAVIAGSILIERVFDIQGFGLLSYQALLDKDYSLIMGTLLLLSVFYIIGNLVADLLVALIDPRVKFL